VTQKSIGEPTGPPEVLAPRKAGNDIDSCPVDAALREDYTMQDRHLKYAITLFGLGVSMLHSEHPQAISRVNVSFDPLRERWQEYSRPHPVMNELYGGNVSPPMPSPAETRERPHTQASGNSSIKSLK
jgi:hypothetical protein